MIGFIGLDRMHMSPLERLVFYGEEGRELDRGLFTQVEPQPAPPTPETMTRQRRRAAARANAKRIKA